MKCDDFQEFLVEFLVIETLHIRINTANNIEDNTDDDDESRSRDEKINISRPTGRKESKFVIELGNEVWESCYECEKCSSKKIETIRNFLEKVCCLLSWTNSWYISSTFLYALSDFCRVERDRYIEK